MNYIFPHTIENCVGEKIIFERIVQTPEGDRVEVKAFCQPGCGPIMHTHLKQDEGLTVISGKMGYQVLGEEPKYAGPGDSVEFKRGVAHRFWAAGETPLHCSGWMQPVNTSVFFLSSIYAAQNKSGSGRPETFDAAYLMTRYASEYAMVEMPLFVKKVVVPITYQLGRMLGKYKHFENAPEPIH
ncbi:cupin domain-containing protein [Segetibacter sp. 3557_3]|uniref:cupin domain-containing protein n=1 Tax=Segetibacter sp. 3557_3 TaxID=2547429 RepID=UPI001059104D|nr:cupin domain-containing protein [Segetibacter sp. 3557_3]TDH24559.1 cupin domain-containing protein [Segetibacter sp. 3557_3]